MMDTCPPPYNSEVWIHRGIHLFIPLWLPWAPADTILEVPWTAIDTSILYYPEVFKNIYDSVGPYVLRKLYPSDTNPSNEGLLFEFRFFAYTPADSVYPYLFQIPGANWQSATPMVPGGGGGVRPSTGANDTCIQVYPMPAHGFVHIGYPAFLNEFGITITDELGQVMKGISTHWDNNNTCTLDFSNNISPGLYFIRCGPYYARIVLESEQ